MRDIARPAVWWAGLCYRYFDSKQKLFQEATEAYVEECCGLMRRTLGDETLSLSQKLDRLYGTMGEEADFRYHGFFHRAGNEDFHQQLSLRLCQRMAPLLREALAQEGQRTGRRFRDPETLIAFVTYARSRCSAPVRRPGGRRWTVSDTTSTCCWKRNCRLRRPAHAGRGFHHMK